MRDEWSWCGREGVGKRWRGSPSNRQQRRHGTWCRDLAAVVVWATLLAAPSLADTATDVGTGFTSTNPTGQITAGVLSLDDANLHDTPTANRLSLKDNDDGGAYSCAANAVAGEITLLDINGTATDDWVICVGTSLFFDIPDTGSDIIANAQLLVGTGAGTGNYVAMSGDVAIDNTGATTIQANSVALGTDTTGGYAGSASEAGPATTALALDANPTDCSASQFANAIAASGNLTCAQVGFSDLSGTATDAQIPDSITVSLAATASALASNPTDCSANQYATAIAANGNLTCSGLTAADMPSGTNTATWTTDADNTGGSEPANGAGLKIEGGTGDIGITYDATNNDLEFSGAAGGYSFDGAITGNLTGNASTATALASNPTDCSANQFANAIAASGNLTCAQPAFSDLSGSATDAQIPNTITVDLATAATALAANGGNCSAGSFPLGVDASGAVETCTAVSFTAAGTSGSSQTISNGDTLTIAAGTGITTTGGATDTITVASTLGTAIDTSEVTDGTLTYPDVNATQTLAGNPANGDSSVWFGTTGFLFEGATSNTSELLLTAADPSADRTITLPDETGTVCTTGSVCSGYQAGPLSGDVVTSGAVSTIQANSVDLGTDTTGNYVGGISCGTGISGCPSSGEGTTGTIAASLGTAIDTNEITDGTITYPDVNATETVGGNPTFTSGAVWFGTTGLLFEGATANTSEGLLTAADVTVDRTWTLPDETGTICTNAAVCSGYQAGPLSGDVVTSGAAATIQANSVDLGTDTTGNYVASATASGGLTMTGTEGGSLGVLLPTATDALSATTSSGSGLELVSAGLALLQGCANNEILKWNETADTWGCATDSGSSAITTLAGDSGTATGSTVTVAGGTNGIDTSASSSTVTLNLDTTEIGSTTFGSGSTYTWTFDGGTGTDATLAVGASGSMVWTGAHDFGGAALEVPNSTTALSTCTVGQIKQDTDATAGNRLLMCVATDTPVGIDNPFGAEIDASELAATLTFAGQELDLNTNSGNALRLPITASNPASNGSIVVDSTAPYELEWYAGSAVRGLSNYAYLPGRAGGQTLIGGDGSAATQALTLLGSARSDGSDDGLVNIFGGGSSSRDRGAGITVYGNEAVGGFQGGNLAIVAGNTTPSGNLYPGIISFATANNSTRMVIENDGSVCVGPITSCTGTIGIDGTAARTFGMENHSTAGSAGNTLTINAGGSGSNSNLNGGDLVLASGRATGNGAAKIDFQTVDANQGSGSSARSAATRLRLRDGHVVALGTAPTASGCGTSPTIAGTDVAGRITIGATPGTCVITFAKAFTTNAPSCVVNNQTSAVTNRATSVGTSSFTISGTLTASDVIAWHCIGYE